MMKNKTKLSVYKGAAIVCLIFSLLILVAMGILLMIEYDIYARRMIVVMCLIEMFYLLMGETCYILHIQSQKRHK